MATKVGVWIDHRQAYVVLLTDAGQETKKIKSGIEKPGDSARTKNKYTPNDFVAEDKRERKLLGDYKKFYDEVVACLLGAKAVLILGPGEAKGEFNKHLQSKKLGGVTIELQTADKMTERQLAAKVSEHFAKAAASKAGAPKKAAKTAPGKRPVKAGK